MVPRWCVLWTQMIPWHFFQCHIDILALYQNTSTIIGWIVSTFMVSRRWTIITFLHWCVLSLYSPVVTINCWHLTSLKNTDTLKFVQNVSCHVHITRIPVNSTVEVKEITDEDVAVSTFSFWPVFRIAITHLQDIPSSLSSTCFYLLISKLWHSNTPNCDYEHNVTLNLRYSERCCGWVKPHRAFHFITSCSLSAVRPLQTIWWVDYCKLMLCRQKLFKPRA